MNATAWAAVAAWVTVAIYLAILGFAWWQVTEAKTLREAESRPFVVVDFDVFTRPPLIYLTIANMGKTLARNVRIRFDPALSSVAFNDTLTSLRMLTEAIPTLAPGRTIPILYDNAIGRPDDKSGAYSVTVTYEGEANRKYTDAISLDLGVYWNWHYIQTHGLNEIHDRLKEIVSVLTSWTAGGQGLLRVSPDEEQKRRDDWYAAMEERHQHITASETPPPDLPATP